MILFKSLIVWVIIVCGEIANGIARTLLLVPYVGDFHARQIGVFTGAVIILTITIIFIKWIGAKSVFELLAIGLLWLVLMLTFEVTFGLFVAGYSWERIAADYNLLKGGLLPIGMFILTLSPLIAAKFRRLI
ncbi:hypothetical protein ACE1B6_20985 [Aerosakkonemataceae cyanobacterium BLCC-F154]|uniref:Uncharacterized protein n=1 Tax=Floridaenema fluviatile BLCC-F154 TaxID=3153640 RepID=A0ABV4YFY2_9CYAN